MVEWFRALDLKSCAPEFKFLSDDQLDLFQLIPNSILQLRLYVGSWSATKCSYLLILINIIYLHNRKLMLTFVKYYYYEANMTVEENSICCIELKD